MCRPRLVCKHKTVRTCRGHKHFHPACLWPCFTHLIRLHINLCMNTLQRHTHTNTQTTSPNIQTIYTFKNAACVVFMPCSAEQKHYKSHKPLALCGSHIQCLAKVLIPLQLVHAFRSTTMKNFTYFFV